MAIFELFWDFGVICGILILRISLQCLGYFSQFWLIWVYFNYFV